MKLGGNDDRSDVTNQNTMILPAVHPPTNNTKIRLQVEKYAAWLAAQSGRSLHDGNSYRASATREMNDYAANAGKTVSVGKRKVQIFAPFRPEHSALQTFTPWQLVVLIVIALAWILGLLLFPQNTLIATMTAITLLYLSHLLLHIVLALNTFGHSFEEEIDERVIHALGNAKWPPYTI